MTDEMITIPESEYDELVEDQKILNALRRCGVDNWEGWYDAMEIAFPDVE